MSLVKSHQNPLVWWKSRPKFPTWLTLGQQSPPISDKFSIKIVLGCTSMHQQVVPGTMLILREWIQAWEVVKLILRPLSRIFQSISKNRLNGGRRAIHTQLWPDNFLTFKPSQYLFPPQPNRKIILGVQTVFSPKVSLLLNLFLKKYIWIF